MNKITTILMLLYSISLPAQDNPTERAQPIVIEGKQLYKSEMASWYGTDVFLEMYKDKTNIGGYFSYTESNKSSCIFFSKATNPKVIGSVEFDNTYNVKTARTDLNEREFTKTEMDLYFIRQNALATINIDTIFKTYNNTNLNLIPLISNNQRKVYVLTGPQKSGVVIFGNDYLLTFDSDNKLISTKQLHKNIMPMQYGGKVEDGKVIEGTIHSHQPETGEFITATDICTLMLYEKAAKWKQHNVVSKEYLNVWNCLTDELVVVPMGTIEKTDKDSKPRRKRKSTDK